MSWYSSDYSYRWPIAIDILGGGGTSGTYTGSIILPGQWDAFWTKIRSNAFDAILVDTAGAVMDFERQDFNYANKTLTINFDSFAVTNNDAINLVWLYWGYSLAADQETSVTLSSPKSGYVWLGKPKNMVVNSTQFNAGASSPLASYTKNDATKSYIWFNVQALLANRLSTYNKFLSLEQIKHVQVSVLNSSGVDQVSMYDENKTRFIPGFVGAYVQAGTNNTDYTVQIKVYTDLNQEFALRALLQIRNMLPS